MSTEARRFERHQNKKSAGSARIAGAPIQEPLGRSEQRR